MTMNRILTLLVLTLAFANCAWAAKDAPSRPAQKGCKWEKLSEAALGVEAWVQQCDFGFRKIHMYAKQNVLLSHFSDGGEDEKLIETFELQANEKPEAA